MKRREKSEIWAPQLEPIDQNIKFDAKRFDRESEKFITRLLNERKIKHLSGQNFSTLNPEIFIDHPGQDMGRLIKADPELIDLISCVGYMRAQTGLVHAPPNQLIEEGKMSDVYRDKLWKADLHRRFLAWVAAIKANPLAVQRDPERYALKFTIMEASDLQDRIKVMQIKLRRSKAGVLPDESLSALALMPSNISDPKGWLGIGRFRTLYQAGFEQYGKFLALLEEFKRNKHKRDSHFSFTTALIFVTGSNDYRKFEGGKLSIRPKDEQVARTCACLRKHLIGSGFTCGIQQKMMMALRTVVSTKRDFVPEVFKAKVLEIASSGDFEPFMKQDVAKESFGRELISAIYTMNKNRGLFI